jgi:hypothetical protein
MAKTYTNLTVANATAGNAILASDFSSAFTTLNNHTVPPMCKATLASNATGYTNNTDISWDAEEYDTDSMHDTATNNARITPTTSGIYLVLFSINFLFSGTSSSHFTKIFKNGSLYANNFSNVARTTTHQDVLSAIVTFNGTTDYVTARIEIGGGTAPIPQTGVQSYLSATFLGKTA